MAGRSISSFQALAVPVSLFSLHSLAAAYQYLTQDGRVEAAVLPALRPDFVSADALSSTQRAVVSRLPLAIAAASVASFCAVATSKERTALKGSVAFAVILGLSLADIASWDYRRRRYNPASGFVLAESRQAVEHVERRLTWHEMFLPAVHQTILPVLVVTATSLPRARPSVPYSLLYVVGWKTVWHIFVMLDVARTEATSSVSEAAAYRRLSEIVGSDAAFQDWKSRHPEVLDGRSFFLSLVGKDRARQ